MPARSKQIKSTYCKKLPDGRYEVGEIINGTCIRDREVSSFMEAFCYVWQLG